MWRWAKGVWHRHKRKIVVGSVLAVGAYGLKKFLEWKLDEMSQELIATRLMQTRRKQNFDSNQQLCDSTVLMLFPKLFEDLKLKQDTEALLLALKQGKGNKLQLWEELKLTSFSRAVVSVYASAFVFVFLRVQSNILGGYMFQSVTASEGGGACEATALSEQTQLAYMQLAHRLTQDGLNELVRTVTEVTADIIGPVPLQQKLDAASLESMLVAIRTTLQQRFDLLALLMAMAEVQTTDPALQTLLDETQDVMDTAEFGQCLGVCLDVGLGCLLDAVMPQPPPQSASPEEASQSAKQEPEAMAKLVPKVSKVCQTLLQSANNPILQRLNEQPVVARFFRGVYDSFCEPQ